MYVVKRAAIALTAAVTTGLCVAPPADADPGFDPCHASVMLLCRFVPMMPDLDHDIDLSQDPDALTDGQVPADKPGVTQPGVHEPGSSQPTAHLPGANQPDADLNGG